MKKIAPIIATAFLCLALCPFAVIASELDTSRLTTLAKKYENTQRYDEAIQIYRHIITMDPTKKNLSNKIDNLNQKKALLKASSSSSKITVKQQQPTTIQSKLTQSQKDDETIAKGYKAIEENQLSTALKHFDSILVRRSKNTLSLYGKALVYEKRKQYGKIVKILSREVTINNDPKIQDLYNRAAQFSTSTKSTNTNRYKNTNTSVINSRLKQGEMLLKTNNLTDAETLFQELYLQNPSDPEILLRLGETYSRLGEFSKAKEYYASTLSYSPQNIYAQEGLAQTHYALKEYKKSLLMYEKIDRKKWNSELDYNYKMAKIANYMDSKEYNKGQLLAEELYQKYPNRPDTIRQLANLTALFNPEQSIRYRTLAFQQSRSMSDMFPLLYALLDANRFTQTETYFNSLKGKTLSMQEKNELKKLYLLYYHKLSSSQLTQGRFEATEQTARSGLLIAQYDAALIENLGWSLLNQNKANEALENFEKLLSSKPTNELYYAAALSAYNAKERKKAYAYLFKASKSSDMSLLEKIAKLYKDMGYQQESLDTIQMIENLRSPEYKKTLNNGELLDAMPSKSLPPTQYKNDLNGVYNPFLSSIEISPEAKKKNIISTSLLESTSSKNHDDSIFELKQKILAQRQNSLSGSLFLETRSGTSGLDSLERVVIPIEATIFPAFKHTFYTGANIIQFHTGKLKKEDQQRFAHGTNITDSNHIESLSGVQPYIGYRYETEPYSYEARLSSTPINSTISQTTPIGFLSGRWNFFPWNFHLKLLQESINDTLLSAVGQKDPYNNEMWGQVVRKGGEGGITYSKDFISSLTLGYFPTIQGINTTSNSQIKGSLFIGKKVIQDDTTDFLIGPLFVYDKYNFSTNHFTYGHGGYFSPTSFFLASLYGDFSHEFSSDAFVHLKGNAGYATFKESSEPYLPLSAIASDSYAANSKKNISFDVKGYTGHKLNDNFHLLGTLGVSVTPQFNSVFAGISLVYYFDKFAELNKNTLKRITYAWDKI